LQEQREVDVPLRGFQVHVGCRTAFDHLRDLKRHRAYLDFVPRPLSLLPGACAGDPEIGAEAARIEFTPGYARKIIHRVQIEHRDPGFRYVRERTLGAGLHQLRHAAPVAAQKISEELADDGAAQRITDATPG